jgi:NAD(P)-dependent dehydrogenase (short-subunit alcohol dehydrogenase family)
MVGQVSGTYVALVTGGAMGIGAEVSKRLAASGFDVFVSDIDGAAAERTANALVGDGHSARALTMDVGKPESVAQAFATVKDLHGRCDVLVNSAGIAKMAPFLELSLDNFLQVMNVNVTGTLLCCQHAARLMVPKQWGRIVNIASVAGFRAIASGRSAYGISKAAVISLTRHVAAELAQHGITVNAVCPGPIDTPLTRELHTLAYKEAYCRAIPMNRYGSTAEIAAAVMYLVSQDAGYVTGTALPIDGGFLASAALAVGAK